MALLLAIGVTAGGVTVYRLRPGVPRSEAAAEGILDGGVRATIAVEGRRLLDDGGSVYGSGNVDGVWRAGDQAIIVDPPNDVEVFRGDRARRNDAAGAVTAGTMPSRAGDCACRAAAGSCLLSDGGQAPFGLTLPEGQWAGAGCIAKNCGVAASVNGDESWPTGCPQ